MSKASLESQLAQLDEIEQTTKAKILGETATIAWKDLLPFFAKGVVIHVPKPLNLVDIAYAFDQDNANHVQELLSQGKIEKVSDSQAKTWLEDESELWAVVVKPFVLVQK